MKEITVDCAAIDSRAAFHDALAEAFSFPDWYGKNLDALHDLLTSIPEDACLTLLHFDELGRCSKGFRRVMEDSEKENPHFSVVFL